MVDLTRRNRWSSALEWQVAVACRHGHYTIEPHPWESAEEGCDAIGVVESIVVFDMSEMVRAMRPGSPDILMVGSSGVHLFLRFMENHVKTMS